MERHSEVVSRFISLILSVFLSISGDCGGSGFSIGNSAVGQLFAMCRLLSIQNTSVCRTMGISSSLFHRGTLESIVEGHLHHLGVCIPGV